jgi:hypothetical protein
MKVTELIKELESYREKVLEMQDVEPDVYVQSEGYTIDIDYIDLWENFSKDNDIIINV